MVIIKEFNVNKAYSTLNGSGDVESDLAIEHYTIDNLLKKKSQEGGEYRNYKYFEKKKRKIQSMKKL